MQKIHKLYCYADESGQDTQGQLFIVAVVVTDNRRDSLERFLEQLEKDTGKKKRKWFKTRKREQLAYIEGLLSDDMPGQLYARTYTGNAGTYDDLTVLAAAQAVNLYKERYGITDNYKVTIAIDGLAKNLIPRIGRSFRELGIKTRNVRGERDESSPIIRLADAVAGLMREATEGRQEFKALQAKLEKNHKLYEL